MRSPDGRRWLLHARTAPPRDDREEREGARDPGRVRAIADRATEPAPLRFLRSLRSRIPWTIRGRRGRRIAQAGRVNLARGAVGARLALSASSDRVLGVILPGPWPDAELHGPARPAPAA